MREFSIFFEKIIMTYHFPNSNKCPVDFEELERRIKEYGSITKIEETTNKHICKYCVEQFVDGNNDDLLCDDCKEVFGHTFYSEL